MALTKAARAEVQRRVSSANQRASRTETAELIGEGVGAFAGGALFGSVRFLGILPANYIAGGLGMALELMSGRRSSSPGRAAFGGLLKGMGLGQLGIEGSKLTGGDLFGFGADEGEDE